ncbi:hypothetical protein CFC21_107708 [Triticum aestivum]|uniref:Fanconi-associated nuclease n=2 Tax=Triticum aestivum TaxID=4565 RepID=A0A9R1MHB1_WHEAT|nr:hypothetical protein CFC21_107708 [Triticum aestivum]
MAPSRPPTALAGAMLTGRESLARLIGRRRRSPLPAPLAAALLSPSHSTPHQADDAGAGEAAAAGPSSSGGGAGAERVACPVCGEFIPGSDYCVNTHLDICLSRGAKRKLTQSSLLDFRFSKKTTAEPTPDILNNSDEAENKGLTDGDVSTDRELSSMNGVTGSPKDSGTTSLTGCLHGSPGISKTLNTCIPSNAGLPIIKNAENDDAVEKASSCLLSAGTTSVSIDACPDADSSTTVAVDTVIVGRRFRESFELQEGMGITVVRDPQNAKDPDAVKVLYAGSDCGQMLGYLPRELAKVLAPLLDTHFMECEGFVAGLPEQQLDNVPIQLTCQKCENDNQNYEDLRYQQSLWENFLGVVRNGNFQQPSGARYQANFNTMLLDVMTNHTHLFSDTETSFLGPWFRLSSISYCEISDVEHAAMELKLAGYIDMFSGTDVPFEHDMKEILNVLSVPEMKEILKELPKDNTNCTRRHELLSTLLSMHNNGTCTVLPKRIFKWTGTCIRVSNMADELLWLVQRLFFLNGDQDLSSFLLVDLGLVKFPDYTCSVVHRIFQERNDLLQYEEAIRVAQFMDESLDNDNMELVSRCTDLSENRLCTSLKEEDSSLADSPPSFYSCFSSTWIYSKILTLGVSVYERERRYADAIRTLKILLSKVASGRRRGYWTLRLSIDLEHMGRPNESLSIAEGGVTDPWIRAGSKIALQKRALRLGKPPRRWKVPSYADSLKRNIKEVNIEGRPLNCEIGAKNVFYGYDGDRCGVEQLALQYYADEGGGWQGTHSEGGIWMTIFGLLMWDVIFSEVCDVFHSKFQTAPLDFETDDFYKSRKDLIEAQLKRIQDGMAEEMLISSWELHQGTSCKGVNWDRHPMADVRAVVAGVGGHRLALLLRHLALDYRSWSSGMPDLLLWHFLDERGGAEAKLVEVKGPKDKLSEQQRAWIFVLMDFGFDVEVCKVSLVSKRR